MTRGIPDTWFPRPANRRWPPEWCSCRVVNQDFLRLLLRLLRERQARCCPLSLVPRYSTYWISPSAGAGAAGAAAPSCRRRQTAPHRPESGPARKEPRRSFLFSLIHGYVPPRVPVFRSYSEIQSNKIIPESVPASSPKQGLQAYIFLNLRVECFPDKHSSPAGSRSYPNKTTAPGMRPTLFFLHSI